MAITLDATKQLLNEMEIKFQEIRNLEDRAALLLSWRINKDEEVGEYDVDVILSLSEPSPAGFEFLIVRSKGLEKDLNFHEAPEDKKLALLSYIADRNNTVKIGRWAFDKNDGEIVVDHPMILEQGPINKEQLERAIHTIVSEAKQGYVVLRRIKQHGDPEQKILNSESLFNNLLSEIATKAPIVLKEFVLAKEHLLSNPILLKTIEDLIKSGEYGKIADIVKHLV